MIYNKDSKHKKLNKESYFFAWFIFLSIVGAFIIYLCYKLPANNYFLESPWSCGDILSYYGVILAAIVTIKGLWLTFEDNRSGIKEQGRLDKLPIFAVTTLNKTGRISWAHIGEEVHPDSAAVGEVQPKYYYKEYKLENLFFIISGDKISVSSTLNDEQKKLVVNEGYYSVEPIKGVRIAQAKKNFLYIPIDAVNVGNGTALNLRIGFNRKSTVSANRRYTISTNVDVQEKLYIGIYFDDPSLGDYTLELFYDDIFENHYKQFHNLTVSSNKKGFLEVKIANIVKQIRLENKMPLCIAMLGHKRIPSREGGVEIVVEELSTRMAALGNSITVFNRCGHNVAGKEYDSSIYYNKKHFTYHGVNVKSVPTINHKGLAAVSSSFFACVKAAFGKYDVVHIHAEGPAYFCGIPHLLGKRVVVTIHGLDWQRAKWGGFASKFIKSGEKHAVKYADEIIVLSKGVQQYFKKTYGRDTTFIPNGVNRPVIIPTQIINDKYGLKKDNYVLYLGRIVPEKGINYLISAWKNISTDKKLVIAGGASDTDEYMGKLHDLAKDDDRIIFTGFTQGQELKELYSNACIYVLPSDLEGMPLSLLEAMSYGNCCLTSDIDECASVIEDHGVTFKKSNVDDLKQKLIYLLENEAKIESYKSTAADFICNKYNWDDVVEKTLELYRK